MSKAHLIFDLSELDGQEDFKCAIRGRDALCALDDFREQLCMWEKNDVSPTLDEVNTMFFQVLESRDIQL